MDNTHPAIHPLWTVKVFVRHLLLISGVLFIAAYFTRAQRDLWDEWLLIWGVSVSFFAIASIFLRHAFRLSLEEREMRIHSLPFSKTRSIPYSAIGGSSLKKEFFGMRSLILKTTITVPAWKAALYDTFDEWKLGVWGTEIVIPGLRKTEAELLQAELTQKSTGRY